MYCAIRGSFKSIVSGSLWFCPLDPQSERILSKVAQILTSKYQSQIDDGIEIDCTSDMMNVLEEVARSGGTVL